MQANLSGCPDTSNWNLLSLIDLYIFFLIIIFIFLPLPPPPLPPLLLSLSLSLLLLLHILICKWSAFILLYLPLSSIRTDRGLFYIVYDFKKDGDGEEREEGKWERRRRKRRRRSRKKKEKRLKLVWSLDSDLFHCRISNSVAGCLIECSCITRPPRSSQSTTIETQSHFISLSAWIPSWGIEIWQRCPTPTHMWWTVNCLAGQICLTATEKR